MPGYLKSREEVQRIEDFLAPSRHVCDELGIFFKTSWDWAREVLPPVFEPIGDPDAGTCDGQVTVAHYESAYCGTYDASIVTIFCSYEGLAGYWMLTEIVSPESPVVLGRELWGEAKKNGHGVLRRDGNLFRGTAERMGVSILEIEATIDGPELGPRTVEGIGFDIKMFPHSSGRGLEYPPILNIWNTRFEYTSYREGTGTLTWGHSKWDPTDTIPILEVGTATATQYACEYPLAGQVQLDDPDGIYPQYMWGRSFDDPTWMPIAQRYRGQDVLNPEPHSPGEPS